MRKQYKQTTYETCLACSLFYLFKIKPTRKREMGVINHSLKFSKNSFVLGHLQYFAKKYKTKKIKLFVENKALLRFWSKIRFSRKINLIQSKINSNSVSKNLLDGPLILLIDNFVLQKIVHYPHYIVLLKENYEHFKIYDPWDGKIKHVKKKTIYEGIQKLRSHLLFSPELIVVD